jgi:glucose/arabinose dehydrogenase
MDFNGRGEYSGPEFIWKKTVGPTAIQFLDSNKYGKQYENDLFVGDNNNGYLYHFDLTRDRRGLYLEGALKDKTADSLEELGGVIFGQNFGAVADIELGPDGYLYILSYERHNVSIFRITT